MNKVLKKALFFLIAAVVLACGFMVLYSSWVFGSGVKAGTLNQVMRKGYVFKTYEGKLIQSGFYSEENGVRSNEFEFSIERKEDYDLLSRAGNKDVELHYKQYMGVLPWRGHSKYLVDSIVEIKDKNIEDPNKLPVELGNQ